MSAAIALAGTLLSGPAGLAIVSLTRPQPAWRDAATFVSAYHPIQTVPYWGGLLLVVGFVALFAALHDGHGERFRTRCALALSTVFAALILANYAIQTTFVPALVSANNRLSDPTLTALTMANPGSVAWTLEMWGYGILGLATWLAAPAIRGGAYAHIASLLFAFNGPVSIAAALMTAWRPEWVLTTTGLVAFGGWNLLIIAMLTFTVAAMRSEAQTSR